MEREPANDKALYRMAQAIFALGEKNDSLSQL
jgi:hypothetical protein